MGDVASSVFCCAPLAVEWPFSSKTDGVDTTTDGTKTGCNSNASLRGLILITVAGRPADELSSMARTEFGVEEDVIERDRRADGEKACVSYAIFTLVDAVSCVLIRLSSVLLVFSFLSLSQYPWPLTVRYYIELMVSFAPQTNLSVGSAKIKMEVVRKSIQTLKISLRLLSLCESRRAYSIPTASKKKT